MENDYQTTSPSAPHLSHEIYQAHQAQAPRTPPPTPPAVNLPRAADLASQPVVRVLSPRGIEYVFLTTALLVGSIGLGAALIALLNGKTSFEVLAFPVASLIVSVPIFAALFLRLKKSELRDPSLRYEASKRRSTQFTQIVSFFTAFFTLIAFVSIVLAKIAGDYHGSIATVIKTVVVLLAISGGLLTYYWHDEHRV